MRLLRVLAVLYVTATLGLLALHVFLPQRSGTLALAQVLEPYIVLTALIVSLAAVASWPHRGLVGVLLFAVLFRYGAYSLPKPVSDEAALRVLTWNVLAGATGAERALQVVSSSTGDLVGLQELQPATATALESDQQIGSRFPYRALAPDPSVVGIGLLSRHPILEQQSFRDPPFMRAVVGGLGEPITVYVVHPLPASFGTLAGVPVSLVTSRRDAALGFIRERVSSDLQLGQRVIVLGDLNTTEREPAYAEFGAGMQDAHALVGHGLGHTWRPARLSFMPFGLIRIDYVFVSDAFLVTGTRVDCATGSDHCAVEASISIRPGE